MYPRSIRLRRALRRAARLRAEGKTWEQIAEAVKRKVRSVERWPHQYPDYWDRRLREGEIEQAEEVAKEVVFILRDLFRKDVTDDRIKSATLLIKLLLERQKIDLKAMQSGILRPHPRDDEPTEPTKLKEPVHGSPNQLPARHPIGSRALKRIEDDAAKRFADRKQRDAAGGDDPAGASRPQ